MPTSARTTASTRLLNGRWLQLRVRPAHGGRDGIGGELIRKRDQRRLMQWPVLPRQVGNPRPRLARHELDELNNLLRRALAQPRPFSAASLRATTLRDAQAALRRLNLPLDAADHQRLPLYPEPSELLICGTDLAGRELLLEPATAQAWRRMRLAAAADQIVLRAVSGFRTLDYQADLVARKRARGMALQDILRYSALPGRSEHHLGTVLDLHGDQGPALEECFEHSDAFTWLITHAAAFGFRLSYPRDNPWQIGYEPWHWRYQLTSSGR